MRSFSAQVSDRVSQYRRRIDATFKASAQDLVERATLPMAQGGRMRVDTGFLRSSLLASTSSMPLIDRNARPSEGRTYQLDDATVEAVILGAQIGDALYFGFTASYARPREYHDGFVEWAARQWRSIVRQNAARAVIAFR